MSTQGQSKDIVFLSGKRTPFGAGSSAFSSAGGGVRITLRGRITMRVEAARPLTRTPFETRDKDWRGFASLWASF